MYYKNVKIGIIIVMSDVPNDTAQQHNCTINHPVKYTE